MAGEKMLRELEMLKNTYDKFWFSFFLNTFFLNEFENVIKTVIKIVIIIQLLEKNCN